jgi:hypothetical protein
VTTAPLSARPRVLVYGVGEIGRGVARLLRQRGYPVVGAVDTDARLRGVELGDVLGEAPFGLRITDDPGPLLRRGLADVAIHATSAPGPDFRAPPVSSRA